MKFNSFEEIIAWQKSRIIIKGIYAQYGKSSDYGFRDQIIRASVSIMNNIAEGFERKTNQEFKQYLFIAKGSCAEVRSMSYVALDIGYSTQVQHQVLLNKCEEVSKLLSGLIKTL